VAPVEYLDTYKIRRRKWDERETYERYWRLEFGKGERKI
jgi:hypothetical protein